MLKGRKEQLGVALWRLGTLSRLLLKGYEMKHPKVLGHFLAL